jgi:cytochrome P450
MNAREPPLVRLDLQSQAFKQDPFPTLAKLRAAGPLVRTRMPIVGKIWLATSYDAASDLLRDHQQFVQNPRTAGNRWMSGLMRWLPGTLRPLTTNMLVRDPPDHRRLRSLVDQAFQRQSIEALRPRLEALADENLDRFAEQRGRAAGGVDLLVHFARPYPLAVICELLGLPPEDRGLFMQWGAGFSSTRTLLGIVRGLAELRKWMRYVREEIQRQTQRPRDGLLAALIEAEESGDRLSEDELVAMVFLLLVAGHETTLHQICGSVWTLLEHPRELHKLTADWSLAESAVQELLRHFSFAQITKPRYAREDTEFHGQPIRRGQMLFACLASANSDESRFPYPERLDLHRHPNRHLAFGAGIHVCLGAKLARVETEIALHKLFTRFPNLRLGIPSEMLRFTGRFGARALVALPLRW